MNELCTYRTPIVLGLHLSRRDQKLLDYWLDENWQKEELASRLSLGQLLKGRHCFPQFDLYDPHAKQLLQSYLPLLLVMRPSPCKTERMELFSLLFEQGLPALWLLPDYGNPVLFPRLKIPIHHKRKGKRIFVLEEDSRYCSLLRQIFYFSSYFHVHANFSCAQELLVSIEKNDCPELIVFNLDHSRIHYTEFLEALEKLMTSSAKLRSELRLLFIKDFQIPGFSFGAIEKLLKPHACRIFSPHEAIFALIYAFLHEEDGQPPKHFLDTILYSHKLDVLRLSPLQMTAAQYLPFLWLYEYLAGGAQRGLFLGRQG